MLCAFMMILEGIVRSILQSLFHIFQSQIYIPLYNISLPTKMAQSKQAMQNTIKNLQAKTDNIHKLEDKGSKAIVLQLGSHSIKMGFANERTPFEVSPFIAYRRKEVHPVKQYVDEPLDYDWFKDQYVAVEEALKNEGVISVDNKPFKGKPRAKQVVNIDRIPNYNQSHNTLYGDQALRVQQDPAFQFRKIISHGCLNVAREQQEKERISDLQNLLVYLMKAKIKIPQKQWSSFTCVIVLPDIFIRRHIKMFLHSVFTRIGFKRVYMHLQSVMACFGSAVNSACVIDIGHQKISVCCVDQGVILPKTLVRKNFGCKDISKVLSKLFNQRLHQSAVGLLKSNSQADLYHLDRVKEIACAIRDPQETINRIYEINPIRKGVQYALQIAYNDGICVASNSFFSQIWNAFEMPQVRDPFNPYSVCFDLYHDEQDYFQQFSGGGHIFEIPNENLGVVSENVCEPFIYQPLQDVVLACLLAVKDKDIRKKFTNNILLIGGGAHMPKLLDQIVLRLNKKIASMGDLFQQEEQAQVATDLPLREIPPVYASWLGGTAIPKLDSLRDLWIERGKFLGCVAMDAEQEEENILDKRLFTRKQQSQEWGIRYLKEKVPFLW